MWKTLALATGIAATAVSFGQDGNRRNWSAFPPAVRNYAPIIERHAAAKGIDPHFVATIMTIESRGNPYACSRSGAQGLMQLMPQTAAGLGVNDPYDPEQNIWGGVRLLAGLLRKYGGNLTKTCAAYNAGPRRVQDGTWVNITETRNYVATALKMYRGRAMNASAPTWTAPAQPAPAAVRVVAPAKPEPNYLDIMFTALQSSAGETMLAENGSLDEAADNMLADITRGGRDFAVLRDQATQYAAAAGFRADAAAYMVTTPDVESFAKIWSAQPGVLGNLVGLAHQKTKKGHVWIVFTNVAQ